MLPALALGAEKPDPGTMRRPPRLRSERLLNWGLLTRAYPFLAPLDAEVWLFILPFGIGMLLVEELRKAATRKWNA